MFTLNWVSKLWCSTNVQFDSLETVRPCMLELLGLFTSFYLHFSVSPVN